MSKEIETVTISYEDFTSYDHIPLGNYYFKNAMGEIIYLKTSSAQLAQEWIDNYAGIKGKYKAIPSKTFKGKSRREDGGYSASGSNTRKCFSPRLKKTN
jgi:hypothetical protein